LMPSKISSTMRQRWLRLIRRLRSKLTRRLITHKMMRRLLPPLMLRSMEPQLLPPPLPPRIARSSQRRTEILQMRSVLAHQRSSPRRTRVKSRPSKPRRLPTPRLPSSPLIRPRRLLRRPSLLLTLPRELPPRTFLS